MMTIMGKRFTNRGISTIIAALLLIAIAVAAGVLLYVFSIGLIGSLQGTGGQQVKDEMIMEAYQWTTTTSLTLQLRNVGSSTLNLFTANLYLAGGGPLGTPTITCTSTGSTSSAVLPGGYCSYSVAPSAASFSSGVAYVIKLAFQDGGVMSYSVVCGTAS
jgi:flagellin-like protein